MGPPIDGTRVIEIAGIGPVTLAGMMLSDLGADVIRVERVAHVNEPELETEERWTGMGRGRRSVGIDLRTPEGLEILFRLVEHADVLVEGFRPGVAERLGFGPEVCRERNKGLVYGRMTGWGQDGPFSQMAGHDLNYLALTGALHAMGEPGSPPPPPLNLVADFGGGALFLVTGLLAALLERERSGEGQTVDAAMIEGAATLATVFYGMVARDSWTIERGRNVIDGGAPFYGTYRTADDKFVSIGAIEPQFYAELLGRLDLDPDEWPQWDVEQWPELRKRFAAVFVRRSRGEWEDLFAGSDACFSPVLTFEEAPLHPQMVARGVFNDLGGVPVPTPAPRFSRTPSRLGEPPCQPGAHTDEVLTEVGLADAIAGLRDQGVVA